MSIRISTRSARNGAAVLATGLMLGVVPGLVAGEAAHAATPTRITITTSASSPVSNSIITVVAHLGVASKPVTFTVIGPDGRTSSAGSATTDAAGNATIAGRATYSLTFVARFAGDAAYSTSISSKYVPVRAKVTTKGSGGKQKAGYRLYKKNTKATTLAKVSPSKTGQRITFRLQKLIGSKWKAFGKKTVKLKKGSKYSLGHVGKPGAAYRVRVEYRGDKLNAANVSAWRYEIFKR